MNKKENNKSKSIFKRFISYYGPYKKLFTLDMIASFLISGIGMCYPIVTRLMLKTYIPERNIKLIVILSVVVFCLYLIRMLLRYFVQYKGHVMGTMMQANMRKDMFTHLQQLPYSYYDSNETGRIMSRMTNDLQDVSELAHHGPENFFISGFMIVATFIYLMTLQPYLTLIIFAIVPIVIFIVSKLKKGMSNAFMESRKSIASINASLENSITGIRVTKAFNNSKQEEKKFAKSNNEFLQAKSKAYKAMGKFQSSTNFVTDLFNLVVLCAGAIFMAYDIITYDVLAAFIVSINLFISPLTTLINFTEQFQDGVTGFKRFVQIMDQDTEKDKPDCLELKDVKGHIEFKNVCFNYESGKQVLQNINLDIKPGEKIALVGPSGGGKTTICHLLPRFYNVNEGGIYIDGINIDDVSMKSLRDSIGIVQQDVFLFNGTIKENIMYGNLNASEEDVILASKKARLYDYIMELEDKFDTQIGERGVRLSGGQKQRLSIARVFLKNPKILILDEATSALDNTTETLIQQGLEELSKNRTTIIVAHRLSTIKSANYIVCISHGKIIEEGSHKELLSKDGVYKKLYLAQFKNQEELDKLNLE